MREKGRGGDEVEEDQTTTDYAGFITTINAFLATVGANSEAITRSSGGYQRVDQATNRAWSDKTVTLFTALSTPNPATAPGKLAVIISPPIL